MLVAVGCSSDSGSKDGKDAKKDPAPSATASGGPSSGSGSGVVRQKPSVEPAKYAKLPSACASVPKKTVDALLPAAKPKSGTPGRSGDLLARASCSWNSLSDQGVKGSQYRWLDVSFLRYDSEEALGVSGAQRATETYGKEIEAAKATPDARSVTSAAASGVGEEATQIGYRLRKTDSDFLYSTVVARTGNIVVTLTFNGTGYAGGKAPAAKDVARDALRAAKDAVAAVTAANKS
jgi:hypothetical protein